MALLVQKFGGTSVGSIERIEHVADTIAKEKESNDCVAVVSAMSGETNRLTELAHKITAEPNRMAQDVLLASGEQVSCALLAIALEKRGIPARPVLAFQADIETNKIFSDARIEHINSQLIKKLLSKGIVPIIAGFQGIYKDEDDFEFLTTLGRGGSDTSAVAIAAAIDADRCDIFTDVDGVYTADPRIVKNARKLEYISFAGMMELASLGAKVLHMRSVEIAAKYKVKLCVRSSFEIEKPGTMIIGEEEMLEAPVVSAITSSTAETLIKLEIEEKVAQFPANLLEPLAQEGVNVDIIVRSAPGENNLSTLNISVPKNDLGKTKEILKDYNPQVVLENAAKLSIVGVGMKTHSGVAAKMFRTLEKENIPILLITTSEIKVSVVIDQQYLEKAILKLHESFQLEVSK